MWQIPYADTVLIVFYPLLKSLAQNSPKCVSRTRVSRSRRSGGTALPSLTCSSHTLGPCSSSPRFGQTEVLSECFLHAFIWPLKYLHLVKKKKWSPYGVLGVCLLCGYAERRPGEQELINSKFSEIFFLSGNYLVSDKQLALILP